MPARANIPGQIGAKIGEVLSDPRAILDRVTRGGIARNLDKFGGAVRDPQGNVQTTPEGKQMVSLGGDQLPFNPFFMGGVQAAAGAGLGPEVSKAISSQVRMAEGTKDPQAVQAIVDNAKRIIGQGGSAADILGRPWHQPVLEQAANSGNTELIGKVMQTIKTTDKSFFKSMMSLPVFKDAFIKFTNSGLK